ncbi:low temperature requirement protein A [Cryobacterium soli]|uniref:low temperature requirement protein A n=1 Tax=Cryobacterium soli TaxID=2220095 RepID=UPI000E76FDB4|nr:low temperature requirement protein A [Cryobacterium soli]
MSTAPPTVVSHADSTRATPLELFFDLVYVFAFTQVTHLMAEGENVRSILGGLAVLGVLWWSWASHAWLANQQATDRGAVRVGILVAIAIVLVLSIAIPEVYPDEGGTVFGTLLFSISFVVLSLVYTAANLVAARHDPALRGQVLRTMIITIVPVAAALIGGALLGGTAQLALWLAAVAIEGVTVFVTSQGGHWQLPSAAHYAERHGLVVILALGESIISIGLAASHAPLSVGAVLASLMAASIALGMWWIYFGRLSETAEHHIDALTGHRRIRTATIGTYLHFGIVTGILLASLGMGGAIEHIGVGHPLNSFTWVALGTGLAVFLASAAAYSCVTRSPQQNLSTQLKERS